MCLITKQIAPIRARKRIEVYKVIYEYESGKLLTGCRFHPIELHSVLRATNNTEIKTSEYRKHKHIYGGYIHCFTDYRTANVAKMYRLLYNTDCLKIVRCYIEPGTLYWKSFDHLEICAKEVYVDDIV